MKSALIAQAMFAYIGIFCALGKFIKNKRALDITQRALIVLVIVAAVSVFAIGVAPDPNISKHARAAMIALNLALIALAFKVRGKNTARGKN